MQLKCNFRTVITSNVSRPRKIKRPSHRGPSCVLNALEWPRRRVLQVRAPLPQVRLVTGFPPPLPLLQSQGSAWD